MTFCKSLFLIVLLSLQIACSALLPVGSWPHNLPSEAYFIDYYQHGEDNHAYQALKDYLYWVETFYLGNALSPGWFQLTRELLEEVDADRQALYAEKMQSLGLMISAEWAQDNNVRLIDTRCASVWRDALLEAMAQDDLDNYLQLFANDVNAILAGELVKEDIELTRYYEVEGFDFF
jgi:hypothetical protein